MEKYTVTIDSLEYSLFEMTVFKGTHHEQTITAAEERLNNKVEEMIEQDRYHEVQLIDESYGYWIPQDIADEGIESEIIDCIESVMREDLPSSKK